MSSANMDSFTSHFPIQMPFISFSLIITLISMSALLLNRNSESKHHCHVLDPREIFQFLTFSVMLARGLSQIPYISLRKFSSFSSLLSVFVMIGIGFLSSFFLHLLRQPCGFCPINMVCYVDNFYMLKLCNPIIIPTWSWSIILFICCQIWFVDLFGGIFVPTFIRDICCLLEMSLSSYGYLGNWPHRVG